MAQVVVVGVELVNRQGVGSREALETGAVPELNYVFIETKKRSQGEASEPACYLSSFIKQPDSIVAVEEGDGRRRVCDEQRLKATGGPGPNEGGRSRSRDRPSWRRKKMGAAVGRGAEFALRLTRREEGGRARGGEGKCEKKRWRKRKKRFQKREILKRRAWTARGFNEIGRLKSTAATWGEAQRLVRRAARLFPAPPRRRLPVAVQGVEARGRTSSRCRQGTAAGMLTATHYRGGTSHWSRGAEHTTHHHQREVGKRQCASKAPLSRWPSRSVASSHSQTPVDRICWAGRWAANNPVQGKRRAGAANQEHNGGQPGCLNAALCSLRPGARVCGSHQQASELRHWSDAWRPRASYRTYGWVYAARRRERPTCSSWLLLDRGRLQSS